MENKNIDIVDKIIEQLKTNDELPYREGAWERFQSKHAPQQRKKLSSFWAAAILLLAGVSGVLWFANQDAITEKENPIARVDLPVASDNFSQESTVDVGPSNPIEGAKPKSSVVYTQDDVILAHSNTVISTQYPLEVISAREYMRVNTINVVMPEVNMPVIVKNNGRQEQLKKPILSTSHHVFAQQTQGAQFVGKEVDHRNKQFNLNEKMSFGLVVSPSSSNGNMNFGGGLVLAYHLNEKWSIRTGATYNQYEAGTLKDPIHSSGVEIAKVVDRPLQADLYNTYNGEGAFANAKGAVANSGAAFIPYVNAVSGQVQTLDIPLEVKYSIHKGLYANGGISYAGVLNQKRYAHYVENVNADPFANGLPTDEQEMQMATQAVTRTLESASANVRTSGFGGFVNLSVGQEIKLKKSFSISVEPFLKLPVGNFKNADMNYRNGGVRIITNF